MLKWLYVLLGLLVVGGYAYASFTGYELTRAKKGFAPQGMRGTQGGARTFFYGGYRGGK
jgi:hypothetical protein